MPKASADDGQFLARLEALRRAPASAGDFHALCELFRAGSASQRDSLRRLVHLRDERWYPPSAWTLADGSPQSQPPAERVRDALTWHAIEGGEFDYRDNLMVIVLIYHSALRLGLDAVALFDEVAAMAPPRLAGEIAGFPRREPSHRSLEAFDYREVPMPGGVRYERIRE